MQESLEGLRESKLKKVNNGGENLQEWFSTIGEEGPLNRFPENPTVEAKKARIPVLPDIPGTTGHSRYYRTIPGDPRSPNAPFSVPTGTTERYYRTSGTTGPWSGTTGHP